MGANESKPHLEDNQSTKSFKRSTSKKDPVEVISDTVKSLKSQIDVFDGHRGDDSYNTFHELLIMSSAQLQDERRSMRKKKKMKEIDNAQRDISDAIRSLEEKVRNRDSELDFGFIESDSFIGGAKAVSKSRENLSKLKEPPMTRSKSENVLNDLKRKRTKNQQTDFRVSTLGALEDNVQKLEQEIQVAIDLEDRKQFLVLEKKIEIFYTDLEMIRVDKFTPLQDKKDFISKQLIRFNNRLKKAKQNLDKRNASLEKNSLESGKQPSDEHVMSVISQIQEELEILEVKASSLQGVKAGDTFKNIKQSLNKHWSKLQDLPVDNDTVKKNRLKVQERIKSILHNLNDRARRNEETIEKQLQELNVISMEVKKFKEFADEFKGTSKDEEYDFIDQNLRKLWANLGNIKENSEEVSSTKGKVIEEIQSALKLLSERLSNHEPKYAEVVIVHKNMREKIIDNLKDFNNQLQTIWAKVVANMNHPELTASDKEEIKLVLQKLCDDIQKQIKGMKYDTLGDTTNVLPTPQALQTPSKKSVAFRYPVSDDNTKKERNSLSLLLEDLEKSKIEKKEETPPPENIPDETDSFTDFASKIFGSYRKISQAVKQESNVTDQKENATNKTNERNSLLETSFDDAVPNEKYEQREEIKWQNAHSTRKSLVIIDQKNEGERTRQSQASLVTGILTKNTDDEEEQKSNAIALNEIMVIDATVQELQKLVQNFAGTRNDNEYAGIEDSLVNNLIKLNRVDTRNQENLKSAKDEVMHHIKRLQDELMNKLQNNETKNTRQQVRSAVEQTKAILEEAQGLKKRIDCFTGVYKSLPYQALEDGLNSCLSRLDAVDANGMDLIIVAKQQARRKIEQWAKILDEKSLKVESANSTQRVNRVSFNMGPNTPYSKLETLRNDLMKLKRDIENFNGEYKDQQYEEIIVGLRKCTNDLKEIDAKGSQSIENGIKQYRHYITELTEYFEEKLIFGPGGAD